MASFPSKPLGIKNYGHIPHLPGSRMGPGDHHCDPGQARIATNTARDRHDTVIVLEKPDGSNVGVARVDGTGVQWWSIALELEVVSEKRQTELTGERAMMERGKISGPVMPMVCPQPDRRAVRRDSNLARELTRLFRSMNFVSRHLSLGRGPFAPPSFVG